MADDRLRLIFTCCHPALRTEHQVALTLRLLGGLTVEEIASGFLVTEPAMAKRLVRALVTLMPDEPEVAGLLAIMVLNESRVPARRLNGAVVLLRDQDRSRWNHTMIDEGHSIVRDCIRRGRPGPYQLQAATQAMHCNAETFEATDWDQIVMLYDHLYLFMPSPVVALNRAIAITETEGPEVGLAALDVITPELENYFMLEVRELPDDNGVDRP